MIGAGHSGAVLVMVERRSRFMIAVLLYSKNSQELMYAMKRALGPYICKSMTMDRGGEFAMWPMLTEMGVPSYFCDAGNPNEKEEVENRIGQLRKFVRSGESFD